jgi:hypothetical protein
MSITNQEIRKEIYDLKLLKYIKPLEKSVKI